MGKVLVAVDFSDLTAETVAYASRVAGGLGHTVDLLHVVMSVLPAHVRAHAPPEVLDQIVEGEEKAALTDLEELMVAHVPPELRGAPILKRGPAAETICDAAVGYDMLVVSTQGRTGLKHMLIGSVAERVVRFAKTPVLVVR